MDMHFVFILSLSLSLLGSNEWKCRFRKTPGPGDIVH